jgi:hypothetical protein
MPDTPAKELVANIISSRVLFYNLSRDCTLSPNKGHLGFILNTLINSPISTQLVRIRPSRPGKIAQISHADQNALWSCSAKAK